MNWDELRRFWKIPKPWAIVPIAQGVNNLTQIIETPAGNYILRAYRQDRSLEQIRYELGVLTRLQGRSLPFQVPVPFPTLEGELFAVLSGTVVSLSPRLSGASPSGADLAKAHAAGEALAQLVKVLENIRMETTSQAAPFPPSWDFARWSGAAIVPADILAETSVVKGEREQVLKMMEEAQISAPLLYQTLPQQIIHRDYDQSNVLMEGKAVTGVLDFEFCGPDLRILELAYALSQWPSGLWNSGKEWAVLDAFGQGYSQYQHLTAAELEAIPSIFRLHGATSLFFHLGRFAQGVETAGEIREHIREALITENWLQLHARELVQLARSWQA